MGIKLKAEDAWLGAGGGDWESSKDAGISASVGLGSIRQSGGKRLPSAGP